MQLTQSLSFQTQHDLAKLFECVIIGQSRLYKCFEYFNQLKLPNKQHFLFSIISNDGEQYLSWQQLTDFMSFHKVQITRDEAIGMLLQMGGNVEYVTQQELFKYLQVQDLDEVPQLTAQSIQDLKNETEMTFVKIVEEELLLERNADSLRYRIEKRWDYQTEALFKIIARQKTDAFIDSNKFKQFFLRLRYPITDEELFYLMKRFGGDGPIFYQNFLKVVLTLTNRVRDAVDEWAGIKVKNSSTKQAPKQTTVKQMKESTLQKHNYKLSSSKNVRYFERLKKKYLQTNYADQLEKMNKPKRTHSITGTKKMQERSRSTSNFGRKSLDKLSKSAVFPKNISSSQLLHQTPQDEQNIYQIEPQKEYLTPQKAQSKPYILIGDNETVKIKKEVPSKLNLKSPFSKSTEKKPIQQQNQPSQKILNQIVVPFYPLIHVMIQDIRANRGIFKGFPPQITDLISQLMDHPEWNQQWKQVGINNYNLSHKDLITFILKYNVRNTPFNQIRVYEVQDHSKTQLDQECLKYCQILFDALNISAYKNRQAKINIFTHKPCSFIQLYEELDQGQKGFLDKHDILNLMRSAGLKEFDQDDFDILFLSLSQYDPQEKITFNHFLKELTP